MNKRIKLSEWAKNNGFSKRGPQSFRYADEWYYLV